MAALKRLLRYLAGTLDLGLLYRAGKTADAKMYALYDASHADCVGTRRSTLAYLFYLFGPSPISWSSKIHSFVTTSSNHSEYCAAAKASREAKWAHMLCSEIGLARLVGPIALFSDSQGAIAMTYNPVARSLCKHVDLADHFAREQVEYGITTVTHMPTAEMTADALTKPLARLLFTKHRPALVSPPTSLQGGDSTPASTP